MTPHELMVGIAASALGYTVRKPEPPSLAPVHADAEWNEHYADAYANAQRGRGDYWPRNNFKTAADGPKHDNEQMIDIMLAAQLAKALVGATDAERWQVFNARLNASIDQYAQDVADARTR